MCFFTCIFKKISKFLNPQKEVKKLHDEIKDHQLNIHKLREDYLNNYKWKEEYSYTLEHITESLNTLIWHKDENHRYLLANPLHCQSFFNLEGSTQCLEAIQGKTDKELIQKYFIDLGIYHCFNNICWISDDYVKTKKQVCHFLESGIIDDEKVLLYLIKTPKFDENKKFIGTIGMGFDISCQQTDMAKIIEQWEFDNKIIKLQENKETFCYYIKNEVDHCLLFNHICPRRIIPFGEEQHVC